MHNGSLCAADQGAVATMYMNASHLIDGAFVPTLKSVWSTLSYRGQEDQGFVVIALNVTESI